MSELDKIMRVVDFTPNEARFCEEYIKSWDVVDAYQKAYGRDDLVQAKKLLRKKVVKEYIIERKKELCAELGIDTTRVMTELAATAFTDITELVEYSMEAGGEYLILKGKEELTRAQRKAIKKITVKRTPGRHGDRVEVSLEVHDNLRAMETLMKQLGMMDDAVNVNVQVNNNTVSIDPSTMTNEQLIEMDKQING